MRRDETGALAGRRQRRLFSSKALVGSSCFSLFCQFLSHSVGSKYVSVVVIKGKATVPAADLSVYWPLSSPEGWPRLNLEMEHEPLADCQAFFGLVGPGG